MLGVTGPLTHRQLMVWNAWYREDMNKPSRADWYSMQNAAYTVKSFADNAKAITTDQFKLRFTIGNKEDDAGDDDGRQEPQMTAEEYTEMMLARRIAMQGGKPIRGLNAPLPEGYPTAPVQPPQPHPESFSVDEPITE